MKRTISYLAATALFGAGLAVAAAPAQADPGPCQLGWSNVEPRSCAQNSFNLAPVFALGNGACVGMFSVGGTAFDGPLYQYSEAPGAAHAVVVRVIPGFSPIGTWGPQLLACDATAVVDWHNVDTGQRGSVSRFVPGWQRLGPTTIVADTGPGRVQLTVRTDGPSIPASAEVFVP
ncbi:hypothetical protein [Nocardia amikacinitolerans]|uniref:hypothetical protein n=1 Tax=Nocardia amikacinitolerans TaxID=756689 RepID=UPI0020A28150|nr:hypothetical protein [Nocardia amikacinitolerans]MCP2276314.1 hypothetical protein [Nocardia amikacinitolerans]MCP2295307.1 hypothetical protein [Nocardia amikacinitolerans]